MQPSEIWITIVVFVFAGFILYLLASRDRTRIQYRAEVQKEIIAKFSSSQELAAFLNSEAGKALLRSSRVDDVRQSRQDSRPKTAKEIVGITIAWGVLILAAGFAVFIIKGLTMVSALLLALGIGFEVNGALGYLFCKKCGTWELPAGSGGLQTHGS
jgi:hypothetical protein